MYWRNKVLKHYPGLRPLFTVFQSQTELLKITLCFLSRKKPNHQFIIYGLSGRLLSFSARSLWSKANRNTNTVIKNRDFKRLKTDCWTSCYQISDISCYQIAHLRPARQRPPVISKSTGDQNTGNLRIERLCEHPLACGSWVLASLLSFLTICIVFFADSSSTALGFSVASFTILTGYWLLS